ncbi:MAG: sigma-70 family RNA polymerase sigma factor [Acidimicrobiia bacterium]|nr:sigma-70 family RNA polymerase sigma factor [Acidimicrobiia bacterium]MDH3470496.1 sigma-70 family RNA polymerase sigma factor [Acidimicrobiia bacterium]
MTVVRPRVNDTLATDIVTAYLNQIGEHELLTAEDERELAQRIEVGREAQDKLEEKAYKDTAERRLMQAQVRRGDSARERFVNSNLRLVVSQARRYRNTEGIDFIDLIQEGNLGLMRAVDKFEWRKGFKFSTYATWWIRQALQRAVAEKSRTVRVPAQLHERAAKVHAVAGRLRAETGREPTEHELAAESGLELAQVRDSLGLKETTSLDRPIGEDGAVLGDFVMDEAEEDPVAMAEADSVSMDLINAIKRLPDREQRILLLRYGFIDGIPKPLDEIGDEFNLTRERIRQIEKRALTRLRHPSFGMKESELI